MEAITPIDSPNDLGNVRRDAPDNNSHGLVFPTLLSRVKALFIDVVLMLIVFTSTSLLIDAFGGIPDFIKGFIFVFMFFAYDPVLTSLNGGTLGHRWMNLTVSQFDEPGKRISIPKAFIRSLVKGLLGWLSFLTVTGNRHRRSIHDFASGSVMLSGKVK